MIGKVLREAAESIRGTEKPTTVPGFLRPIDTDAVAREIGLEVQAAERGKSETPPSSATGIDAIEQQIVHRIESEWSWQGGEFIQQLKAYAQRLIAYSVAAEFTRLEIRAKDTLSQLREADHRGEAELGGLREHYIACRNELQDFRKDNRLTRAPRLHPRRWTAFGLLTVLVVVESAANAIFFAKGSEFGLLGGLWTAIVISFLNVTVSFLLGLWPVRWMNRRGVFVKLAGFVLTLVVLAGICTLHGFAAHYRDATAVVGEERALAAALASLQANPLKLADLNTYILFFLGMLFALLAIYKGATFDDPYPGFGSRARRHEQARQDYSDRHADLFDDLAEIKDETIKILDAGINQLPRYPQQAANIRAQRAGLVETFRGYEGAIETAANRLLSDYRDTNRRWRTTPAPSYFDRLWHLPHSFLNSSEARTLIVEEPKDRIDIEETLRELSRLSQEVLTEYEKLMTTYPHPTKMS